VIETVAPLPSLRHLARLSNAVGIFEHARLDCPRPECGYCTDDAGRLLAVASRMGRDPNAPLLAEVALGFLERAHLGGGRFDVRQGVDGTWTDDRPSDNAAGRALLGLGTAVARAPWTNLRDRALVLFGEAVDFRSEHPRAVAYAALGSVELLQAVPNHPVRAAWSVTPRTPCPALPPRTHGRGAGWLPARIAAFDTIELSITTRRP
jgi:hypothetical protein